MNSISAENQMNIFAQQAQSMPVQRVSLSNSRRSDRSSVGGGDPIERLKRRLEGLPSEQMAAALIHNLSTYIEDPETSEFVIERLADLPNSDIYDYLLELVYLLVRYSSESLERFILYKCSVSIPLYLEIKWLYESFTARERQDKIEHVRCDLTDRKIEEAMVNSSSEQSQMEHNIHAYLDKEHRSNYVDSIHIFVQNLVKISLTLKTIPSEDRNLQLRMFLIKANRSLVSFRQNNPGIIYCQGIMLPFHDEELNSNLVVRVIESDCQSFKTKKRVPYRILVETINMQELKGQAPRLTKQVSDQQPLEDEEMPNQDHKILEDFLARPDKSALQMLTKHNTKRFNLLFPPEKQTKHQSCGMRIQSNADKPLQYDMFEQNKYNGYRMKHKKKSEISDTSRVRFIRKLQQDFPNHNHTLNKMFIGLKLDTVEQQAEIIRQTEILQHQSFIQNQQLPYQEVWEDKVQQIRNSSPYGGFKSYRLRPLIVKGGDDLRQELMIMQVLRVCEQIFYQEGTGLFVKTYEILVTSVDSGILEYCTETLSIDALKKRMLHLKGLRAIYLETFPEFEEAQKNFIDSLAAYSVIQYLFQIKDRHNGNILIDSKGHLIHIDFGFILSVSPGGINFEKVPFKLTKEYVELMDGKASEMFIYFKQKLVRGFLALQKHADRFLEIFNIMRKDSDLPCFEKFDGKVFKDRFMEGLPENELILQVEKLVHESMENTRTIMYDNFQKFSNGILP